VRAFAWRHAELAVGHYWRARSSADRFVAGSHRQLQARRAERVAARHRLARVGRYLPRHEKHRPLHESHQTLRHQPGVDHWAGTAYLEQMLQTQAKADGGVFLGQTESSSSCLQQAGWKALVSMRARLSLTSSTKLVCTASTALKSANLTTETPACKTSKKAPSFWWLSPELSTLLKM